MNQIIIHGRLVRDPELKTAASGNEFCKFTVAVDRRPVKDKPKEADFFDCTAFGKTGAAISQYMNKGREILIEGRMESNTAEKDGQKRTYWGISVESFDFCGKSDSGTAKGATAEPVMVETPAELPF